MATNTRILVINPGSTSTKIAIYQQEKVIFLKTIKQRLNFMKKMIPCFSKQKITQRLKTFENLKKKQK